MYYTILLPCRHVFFLVILWLFTVLLLPKKFFAQELLNGSFETSSIDCSTELSNEEFTTHLPQVFGFGELDQPDILSASCQVVSAQDGNHFVGLRCTNGITDAIGIELSEPLVPGQFYTLQFYERLSQAINEPVRLSIGIANRPTSHGELLFTLFELNSSWTKHTFQFIPPINGSYITVIVETAGDAWVFIDNFSLICPSINLGRDTTYCEVPEISLHVPNRFNTYRWTNGSAESSILIQEPGMYWVEATSGNCIVRDTIRIYEDENTCPCSLYIPNAFSPNADRANDSWCPLTPCLLKDYHVQIYNRFGNLIYETTSPDDAWKGVHKQKDVAAGVYIFLVWYQFENEEVQHREQGTLTLIR